VLRIQIENLIFLRLSFSLLSLIKGEGSLMISILSSLMLFFSVPSFADVNFEPVDTTGEMCVRTFSYDNLMAPGSHWLSAAEQSALSRGEQVSKFFSARSGYPIGYIFRVADFDPEVAMAVYIQAEKHAGKNGLGEFF
jgi:hypothetical protein